MNKFKKNQKSFGKNPGQNKTVNDKDDIEKPEYSSDDTAIVKFYPLQRYLSEISKHKLLTREQEI